jgi:hypothetical protein
MPAPTPEILLEAKPETITGIEITQKDAPGVSLKRRKALGNWPRTHREHPTRRLYEIEALLGSLQAGKIADAAVQALLEDEAKVLTLKRYSRKKGKPKPRNSPSVHEGRRLPAKLNGQRSFLLNGANKEILSSRILPLPLPEAAK